MDSESGRTREGTPVALRGGMRWMIALLLWISGCGGRVLTDSLDADAITAESGGDDTEVSAPEACEARARELCRGFGACVDRFQWLWYGDQTSCIEVERHICERDVLVAGVVDPIAQVRACTKVLAAGSACPRGAVPLFCAGARAGTLPDRSPCQYDEQCAGGLCNGGGAALASNVMLYPPCGFCAQRPRVGDPCSKAEDRCGLTSTTLRDLGGLRCDLTAGKCVAPPPIGTKCTSDVDCPSPSTCTDGRCIESGPLHTPLLPADSVCADAASGVCTAGQYCNRPSLAEPGRCTDPWPVGARCFGPGQCGRLARCATSPGEGLSRCSESRPTCPAYPSEG